MCYYWFRYLFYFHCSCICDNGTEPLIEILSLISKIFSPVSELIDNVHTSDEEKLQLQKEIDLIKSSVHHKLIELEMAALEAQKSIIIAEATGQSWLQRNWRPLLMVIAITIIANNYLLFPYLSLVTDKVKMLELPDGLYTLLTTGVGGYVVGRSGEKIAKSISLRSKYGNN